MVRGHRRARAERAGAGDGRGRAPEPAHALGLLLPLGACVCSSPLHPPYVCCADDRSLYHHDDTTVGRVLAPVPQLLHRAGAARQQPPALPPGGQGAGRRDGRERHGCVRPITGLCSVYVPATIHRSLSTTKQGLMTSPSPTTEPPHLGSVDVGRPRGLGADRPGRLELRGRVPVLPQVRELHGPRLGGPAGPDTRARGAGHPDQLPAQRGAWFDCCRVV